MTASQKLQMKMSELREKANRTPATKENIPIMDQQRAELAELEKEYRMAVETESREVAGASFNAESNELRQLVGRASVGRILAQVSQGRSVNDGPERELQEHFGIDGNAIPLRMLMPEHRAAASFGADAAEPGSIARNSRPSIRGFA